jgi:oligopeptide transport system substrate-binding protein
VHQEPGQNPDSRAILSRFVRAALAVALPLAAAVLAACGEERHGPDGVPAVPGIRVGTAPAADQTLRRALDAMPRSLDPSLLTELDAQKVTDDLFEGLTALGRDGSLVPGVASSWEVSADGRHWVFHLRPEARWSNGEPVTSADFLFAWRRQVDPRTGSEYAQALAPIAGALAIAKGQAPLESLGVATPDPLTVQITLNSPTPYLLSLLCDSFMQPLHRATLERWGENWTRPEHWVSNGPFVLKEVVIGNRITLEKNPLYWGAAGVRPTRVIYFPLDTLTQVNRFMAGDIDITSIFPDSQFEWLKSRLGGQVVTGPYLGISQMAVNMLGPPFGMSRDLRLALNLALDRTTLANKLRAGIQEPAFSLIPPLPGYRRQVPEWASWSDARRHAEARRLYAAAGYSAAHPLRVQADYPTGEDNRDLYDAIAAMWLTNLGAEVLPYNEEFRVLLQNLRLHKSSLFQSSWIGDYPDPFTFLQLFQTGFEQNFGGYSDPSYDALLSAAAQEADPARRLRFLEQAERRLNEDGASIPIMYYVSRHLVKPYVEGWQPNVQDRIVSRYLSLLEHEGH